MIDVMIPNVIKPLYRCMAEYLHLQISYQKKKVLEQLYIQLSLLCMKSNVKLGYRTFTG